MEFVILKAGPAEVRVRSFHDQRDWFFGIVKRGSRRVMTRWYEVRSSVNKAVPTRDEEGMPFQFACDEARRRNLID